MKGEIKNFFGGNQSTPNTLLGIKHYITGIAFWKMMLERSNSSKQMEKMFSTSEFDEHSPLAKHMSPQGKRRVRYFHPFIVIIRFPCQINIHRHLNNIFPIVGAVFAGR